MTFFLELITYYLCKFPLKFILSFSFLLISNIFEKFYQSVGIRQEKIDKIARYLPSKMLNFAQGRWYLAKNSQFYNFSQGTGLIKIYLKLFYSR